MGMSLGIHALPHYRAAILQMPLRKPFCPTAPEVLSIPYEEHQAALAVVERMVTQVNSDHMKSSSKTWAQRGQQQA